MLKKHFILTLSICLLCFVANAQIVNIPDANFKNALVNTLCVDTDGDSIGDIDADTNNDGKIQLSEALAVTSLNISSRSIQSLEGIKAFIQLKELDCSWNKLKTLDVLGLSKLQELNCGQNQLKTLDVQELSKLQELNCGGNQLTTIDVRVLSNLQKLYCYTNKLMTLDIQGLNNLQVLHCAENELATLDVHGLSNLQTVDCGNNELTTLDVQGLNNMNELYCDNNQLNTLYVHGLSNLQKLNCYANQLTTLNVQGLSNLRALACHDNQLTILDLQGLPNLLSLYCFENQLTELYIKNGSIETSLEFGINPQLKYICCDEAQATDVNSRAALYGLSNCEVNSSCSLSETHVLGENTPAPLHMYPNPVPVGDVLYFEDMPEGNSSISLIDPFGKVVFAAEPMGNSVRLPSALAVGVYFLQWNGEKGAKRWGKVWVKE